MLLSKKGNELYVRGTDELYERKVLEAQEEQELENLDQEQELENLDQEQELENLDQEQELENLDQEQELENLDQVINEQPNEDWKVVDIQEYLDAQEVAYSKKATKKDLLILVQEVNSD